MLTAIAETVTETATTVAETATETAASTTPSLGITSIILLVLGVYAIVKGVAGIVTKKAFDMNKSAAKYTEESLRAYAPYEGLSSVVLGLAILVINGYQFVPALSNTVFMISTFEVKLYMVLAAALIIIGLLILIPANKKLVKKDQQ